MKYTEILPGERLKPYVKCYYLFESEASVELEDTVFPGGHIEVIFNLGEGKWKSAVNEQFQTTPEIELWGQITRPLPVQSVGKNKMLGIRFFAHSAACFFKEEVWEFNDRVSDARDLMGKEVRELHSRLLETQPMNKRIELIENFLLARLTAVERKPAKITMIGLIIKEIQQDVLPGSIESIASRYDITPRYLQKLFLQYTGLTPKLYHKINRFQVSLKLVTRRQDSLTSIAYDCGYFDQSHFIREFKSFTGITPSAYTAESFPVSLALSNS